MAHRTEIRPTPASHTHLAGPAGDHPVLHLLLAVSATLPATTAASITALLVLHVPVAVPAYLRFLPLPGSKPAA